VFLINDLMCVLINDLMCVLINDLMYVLNNDVMYVSMNHDSCRHAALLRKGAQHTHALNNN
jgi:hypothetical protein